jgi:hypothetical protein
MGDTSPRVQHHSVDYAILSSGEDAIGSIACRYLAIGAESQLHQELELTGKVE